MNLRPSPARWFELLTTRAELTRALECLAHTGAVELQTRSEPAGRWNGRLAEGLAQYQKLRETYGPYWPAPGARPPSEPPAVATDVLRSAARTMAAWVAEAAPLITRLEALDREQAELELLQEFMRHGGEELPDLRKVAGAGPMLASGLFVIPQGWPASMPPSVLVRRVRGERRNYLLAVGTAEQLGVLGDQLAELKARRVDLPAWLPGDGAAALAVLEQRQATVAAELSAVRAGLEELNRRYDLARVLGDFTSLEWLERYVPSLPATERLAWVTGWTSDTDGRRLESALSAASVHGLLRLAQPPLGFEPPMILTNPGWARPFELFLRMFGVPGASDVDPSRVVAFIAPVLFGYMFGDVGQGLVLLLAGLTLRRRIPALALLIPGGIMSMAFGLLFGSVFAREDLLPALWLRPLEDPITLLLVALLFGSIVIAAGLLLETLQWRWHAEQARSWRAPLALLASYCIAVTGLILDARIGWLVLPSVAWYLFEITHGAAAGERARTLGRSLSELTETAVRLIINTLSFVRVGAFALGHAGLGIAVVSLAEAAGSRAAALLVMVLGNGLVIVLEGLVVGIQTTRLVLFEFFIRFIRSGGRPFAPLPPPGGETHSENE